MDSNLFGSKKLIFQVELGVLMSKFDKCTKCIAEVTVIFKGLLFRESLFHGLFLFIPQQDPSDAMAQRLLASISPSDKVNTNNWSYLLC